MSAARPKAQRPLWINDRAVTQGFLELDGKRYGIQKEQYPHNPQAEEHVLGCILVAGETGRSREAMQKIGFLKFDAFFSWANGWIFRIMERLYQAGDAVDVTTVSTMLARLPKGQRTYLDEVGGEAYLLRLANATAVNIETYARMVATDALRRTMKFSAREQAKLADKPIEMDTLLVDLHRTIQDLQRRYYSITDTATHNLYDALEEHMRQAEADLANPDYEPGIPTGIDSLDKVITGWRKGLLYIFAAPSGWGKTAWFLSVALKALLAGRRVLFISTEMPERDILDRLLCIFAGVDTQHWGSRNGSKLSAADLQRVRTAAQTIRDLQASKHFIIARMKRPTMRQIRAKIEDVYLDPGVDLVILDYASPNKISDDGESGGDDFRLMSNIYTELESLKEDYEVPLVVGTQMNQKWDSRGKKRPGRTDLFYGSVGVFAADTIAYLYHPHKVDPDDEMADPTLVELLFRKNRSGPNEEDVTVELHWEAQFTRFSQLNDMTFLDRQNRSSAAIDNLPWLGDL